MSDQSQPAPEPWAPPQSDQEFKFEDIASAPAWADKNWATAGGMAIPMGNLDGTGPYHTATAKKGDTVKFSAKQQKFTIIPAEPEEGAEPPKRAAQVSAASLEDQLRGGSIEAGDLDDDAKAQVASRSPGLAKMLEAKS